MSDCFVYALVDPRTKEARYVGQTSIGMERPLAHSQANRYLRYRTHQYNWIKQLVAEGLKPGVIVLEKCSVEDLNEAECFHIAYLRSIGCRLTNQSTGGDSGARGYRWTEEQKAKKRGRPTTGRVTAAMLRAGAEAQEKPVEDQDGNWWASATIAAAVYGVSVSGICTSIRRGSAMRNGRKFRYVGSLSHPQ